MPPVLGPVSPSPTRLWSRAGASGRTVRPSVTASRLASGPAWYSSSRMRAPASPWTPPTRAAWIAAVAAARSSVTVTPLPAASPSALTTQGGPKPSRAATARAGSVKASERAVGTPAAAMTSLAKALEPSMRQAAVQELVGHPGDQRLLGADDGQVDPVALGEAGQPGPVGGAQPGHVLGQ